MDVNDAPSSISPSSSCAFPSLLVSTPVYLQKSSQDLWFVGEWLMVSLVGEVG